MFLILPIVVSSICLSNAAPYNDIGGRIVNGEEVDIKNYPYMVSVKELGLAICGGSILDEYNILTAAHCFSFLNIPRFVKVQYGTTNVTSQDNLITAEDIIIHKDFNVGPIKQINDIAIIKLANPLPLGDSVKSIILPAINCATPEKKIAALTGWGAHQYLLFGSSTLQEVDLNIYTDDDCETIHKKTGPTDRRYNICAGVAEGGKGQCTGDSGGPLVVDGVQVGIVSWSVKPCAVKGYPGVFTKVSTYVDWIKANLKKI